MKIIVKGNNAVKAFKVLKRKLEKDGFYKELQDKRFYIPKGEKRRKAKAAAILRHKKEQRKRAEMYEAQELNALIDSKKRARKFKQQKRANQQKN